jgi:HlyD family secretion protein
MDQPRTALDELRIDRSATAGRERSGWWLPLFLLLLIAGGAATWWLTRSKVPTIATATARAQTSGAPATLLNASGYVTARRAATVSSKVTGKVVEVLTEEGKQVEAGQILARLDGSNVEAGLHLAEAQLESARSALEETRPNLAFAQQELRRFTDLAATKVVSDSDLRKIEAEAKALLARLARQTAEVAVAQSQVEEWKQQLEDTIIRAPFAGIVTAKNAQPGEMISTMSAGGFTRTGICTIVDMTSLEIEVDVNENFINRVQPGLPVRATLNAYPDWQIPAKVIAIIPTADRQKATVKVRIGFDQLDPRILPDMGVKVAFQSGGERAAGGVAVVVPKSAIQQADGRDVVWIVRDGRLERRAITVAQTSGDESTIAAGLSGGEKVVVNPPGGLADGAKISEN